MIRTLNVRLHIQFTIQDNLKWLQVLQDVVCNYKDKEYQTIKMAPADATADTFVDYLRNVVGKSSFNLGDVV